MDGVTGVIAANCQLLAANFLEKPSEEWGDRGIGDGGEDCTRPGTLRPLFAHIPWSLQVLHRRCHASLTSPQSQPV